jgi:hypothetical protein
VVALGESDAADGLGDAGAAGSVAALTIQVTVRDRTARKAVISQGRSRVLNIVQ